MSGSEAAEIKTALAPVDRFMKLFGWVAGVAALGSLSDGSVNWLSAFGSLIHAYRSIVDTVAWLLYGWIFHLCHLSAPRGLADLSLLFALSVASLARADEEPPPTGSYVFISVLCFLVVAYFYAGIALIVWICKLAGAEIDGPKIEQWFIGLLILTYLGGGIQVAREQKGRRLKAVLLYSSTVLIFGFFVLVNATIRKWFGMH
jgi:hypothetical protein